jgi:hypothetical protein
MTGFANRRIVSYLPGLMLAVAAMPAAVFGQPANTGANEGPVNNLTKIEGVAIKPEHRFDNVKVVAIIKDRWENDNKKFESYLKNNSYVALNKEGKDKEAGKVLADGIRITSTTEDYIRDLAKSNDTRNFISALATYEAQGRGLIKGLTNYSWISGPSEKNKNPERFTDYDGGIIWKDKSFYKYSPVNEFIRVPEAIFDQPTPAQQAMGFAAAYQGDRTYNAWAHGIRTLYLSNLGIHRERVETDQVLEAHSQRPMFLTAPRFLDAIDSWRLDLDGIKKTATEMAPGFKATIIATAEEFRSFNYNSDTHLPYKDLFPEELMKAKPPLSANRIPQPK